MKRGMSKKRFEEVFAEGIRVHGVHCRVASLQGSGVVGFATAKKIGNTPKRNRVKRRLREAVRICLGHVETTWDCIFIANLSADSAQFGEIKADIQRAISRLQARWDENSASS